MSNEFSDHMKDSLDKHITAVPDAPELEPVGERMLAILAYKFMGQLTISDNERISALLQGDPMDIGTELKRRWITYRNDELARRGLRMP
jgi:hypothetical protein